MARTMCSSGDNEKAAPTKRARHSLQPPEAPYSQLPGKDGMLGLFAHPSLRPRSTMSVFPGWQLLQRPRSVSSGGPESDNMGQKVRRVNIRWNHRQTKSWGLMGPLFLHKSPWISTDSLDAGIYYNRLNTDKQAVLWTLTEPDCCIPTSCTTLDNSPSLSLSPLAKRIRYRPSLSK